MKFLCMLSTYTSKQFKESTERMIELTDRLASQTTGQQIQKIFSAFESSSKLELEFWDTAYHAYDCYDITPVAMQTVGLNFSSCLQKKLKRGTCTY